MSGGGMSKGGQQQTKVNSDLAAASTPLLARGAEIANRPYVPNRGNQFAAFTPSQEAAFAGNNQAAAAFGMPVSTGTGLPTATIQNGIAGYGTGDQFDTNVAQSYGTTAGGPSKGGAGGPAGGPAGLLGGGATPAGNSGNGGYSASGSNSEANQDRKARRARIAARRAGRETSPPRRDGSAGGGRPIHEARTGRAQRPDRPKYDGPTVVDSLASGGMIGAVANLINRL